MTAADERVHVGASLAHYAAVTRAEIETYLPADWSPDYLRPLAADYLRRGGKGIRPALLLATCEAFGGTIDEALPSAAALEMLHNAFLIHDDIEDHSELRRGAPALHRRYGTALAINAGDALALAGMGALGANSDRLGSLLARRVFEEFDFMAGQTADGQAMDLGWRIENHLDLTPDDYLHLIMKKTCWYTTVLPLRVGALIGSGGRADLRPMVDFGFFLGAAFQIQDDLLNLTGDPTRYGKERLGDLREAKRTLVLIHLLAAADRHDRARIEAFLDAGRDTRSEADVEHLFGLMQRYGSIGFAREFARGIATSAEASFERAFADAQDGAARQFVHGMISFMVERDL